MLNYIKSRLISLTSSNTSMARTKKVKEVRPSDYIREDAQARYEAMMMRGIKPSDKIPFEVYFDAVLDYLDENA